MKNGLNYFIIIGLILDIIIVGWLFKHYDIVPDRIEDGILRRM